MRAAQLPTLDGFISNGEQLRREVAKSISQAEVYAKRSSTLPASVSKIDAFIAAMTAATVAIKALPSAVVLSGSDVALSLASDQTEQLVLTKTPLSGSTSNVASDTVNTRYTSSNVAVATVSATGLVTAVGVGSCTITAVHKNKTSNALAITVAA